MRRCASPASLVLTAAILFQTAAIDAGSPSGDAPGGANDPENLLHGSWHCIDYGVHGHREKPTPIFTWGSERKHFPDRESALLAGMLLRTPLKEMEGAADFSLDFELTAL